MTEQTRYTRQMLYEIFMKKWTSHHLLRDTILCLETFTSLQNTEYMCMVTGTSLYPFVQIRSNAQVLRDLLRRYQWGSDEPWISTGRCKLHSNNVKLVLHCCTSLYNSWKRSELQMDGDWGLGHKLASIRAGGGEDDITRDTTVFHCK